MKKIYYVGFVLFVLTCVFLILRFGQGPKTKLIMTPSMFDRPEELGAVVMRRLYVPLETQRLVVFGTPVLPKYHRQIVSGFLEVAASEKRAFDFVLKEPKMPDLPNYGGAQVVPLEFNQASMADVIRSIKMYSDGGKRVLIYTSSIYSTHLIDRNPIHRLELEMGEAVMSVTTSALALNPESEKRVDPPCLGVAVDSNGVSALGCRALQLGRNFYRKKIKTDRFVAVMDQEGPRDFLLLVTGPGADEFTPVAGAGGVVETAFGLQTPEMTKGQGAAAGKPGAKPEYWMDPSHAGGADSSDSADDDSAAGSGKNKKRGKKKNSEAPANTGFGDEKVEEDFE